MLTIKQCKNYIPNFNLTDDEIEEIRDSLYLIVGEVYDDFYGEKQKNDPKKF